MTHRSTALLTYAYSLMTPYCWPQTMYKNTTTYQNALMFTCVLYVIPVLLPVWLLTADAKGVVVNQEVYNVHDVTGTMKQFFRNLPDPLLTHHLYDQFIEAAREWSVQGWEGCVCVGGWHVCVLVDGMCVCWWMACVCVGGWHVCGEVGASVDGVWGVRKHTHTYVRMYVCMWRAWCVTG